MIKYFAIEWEAGDTLAKLFLISSFIEKRLNKTFSFKPYRVTEIQLPCGHPTDAIVSSDEGTSHCSMCEEKR